MMANTAMTQPLIHPLHPDQPRYGYAPADLGAPPAVSVVTPYYNTGPLFLETAEALLRQSLQQWEWVIVNDGSDDPAALRALLPLRSADPRIRVVDTPNRGPSAARNAGVAAARGDLIFFLDSDDLLAPTALEQLAWALVSHPGSMFAGSWTATFGREQIRSRSGFNTRHAFLYDNTTTTLVMIRRAAFERAGGFDETLRRGLEDYEFWVRCAAKGMWGHDIPSELVWIRRKTLAEYPDYRWDFQQDQRALPDFRRRMRAAYPDLFRTGLPRPAVDGAPATAHALVDPQPPFANRLRPRGARRVLMLVPWVRIGGADRYVLDLAGGLMGRGDCVTVAMTRGDEPHDWIGELRRITPDIFDLPSFLRPGDFPRFLRYLIESRGITHIWISNSVLGYQLVAFLRAHCPHVAVVDYNHIEQPFRHGGMPRVGVEHSALLDLHITSSEYLRRWMVERGADPDRVAVCTTNIDTQQWRPDPATRARARAALGVSEPTPVILFAARLSAQKRVRMAGEILRRLRDTRASFLALVAGDGEDALWLRAFIRRHGLGEHIRMLGAVPHTRVRELMAASDIIFLPSEHEGVALTLYEALASGVAVVASDVGGQRELVTPACGVLVPHGPTEIDQYVAALQRLTSDLGAARAMGAAGRDRVVAEFGMPQMLDRMQALLDQAARLAHEAPRPPVPASAGDAMAILAIEHDQLDQRLRRLPPAQLLLRLRHSSFVRLGGRLTQLRELIDRFDRAVYVARRSVMRTIKRLRGRPYAP